MDFNAELRDDASHAIVLDDQIIHTLLHHSQMRLVFNALTYSLPI